MFELPDLSLTQSLVTEWLIRSVAISALALLGFKLLGRESSAIRCRFLFGAIVLLFVLPISLSFVKVEVPLPWGSPDVPASEPQSAAVFPVLLPVWIAGCCGWLLLLGIGLVRLHRQLGKAIDLEGDDSWSALVAECCSLLHLRRQPRVLLTPAQAMPCVIGVFRPTVLLPENAMTWGSERRRMVLLHELGHLKRGDLWLQWISLIVRGLYWFNPLVKSLHHALLVHREEACDALVVAAGARPKAYARHLLEIATTHQQSTSLSPALAMAGRGNNPSGLLERRIESLLDRNKDRRRATWLVLTLMTSFGLLALAVACVVPALTAGEELDVAPWTTAEVELRWSAEPFPTE